MKIFNYRDVKAENRTTVGASGQVGRWLITRETGCENFELRMFEIRPQGGAPMHTHSMEHAVYILEGKGAFFSDEEEREIRKGDVIFVPPGKRHGIKNTGEENIVLLDVLHPDAVTRAV